jgi:bacterioferritin (cytochrome b1)
MLQKSEQGMTRGRLAELLNEDLYRGYQAIIAYVVYSQLLKGAAYMNIADQLETPALEHAPIISRQIDYFGKMPSMMPKPVRTVSVFCADVSVPSCLKLTSWLAFDGAFATRYNLRFCGRAVGRLHPQRP